MNYINFTTPISKLLKEHPFRVVFSTDEVKEFIVSEDSFQSSIEDIQQRLKFKLKTGLCSSFLIRQLARHKLGIGEKFGDEIHYYHTPSILNIIECNENGQAVNVRPFNKPTLNTFKHIHHNSCTFISKNIENHWKSRVGKEDEIQFQNKLLNEIYNDLLQNHDPAFSEKNALKVLLNKIHNESIFKNIERKTGEWIIFKQINNINYYLCLATHNETKPNSDQVVLDRIESCIDEFPELKSS